MKTDKEFNLAYDALCKSGWLYLGCDYWRDPETDVKFSTSTAYKVMKQRAKRQVILQGIKTPTRKPRLLMCNDWEGIAKEIRRQLKPFGLTVKVRGNYKKWGDMLDWEVMKLASD